MICDWWISIRFVCFCVSRFFACDRFLTAAKNAVVKEALTFNVRMFVISAVIFFKSVQPCLRLDLLYCSFLSRFE